MLSENGEGEAFLSDPEHFSSANRRRLSGPGLRTFLAIADHWHLDEEQRRLVLGSPSPRRYTGWVAAGLEHRNITLDVDTLTRISAILGIHQALVILFETGEDATAWLRGPHKATVFGGESPLALITNGTLDVLLRVRRFLDAATTGQYMAPNEIDLDFRPYRAADILVN